MFAGAKLKEVPRKQAEEFTADVASDPKFLRHVERQEASATVTAAYVRLREIEERTERERESIARTANDEALRLRTEAALLFVSSVPTALVAALVAGLPWPAARAAVAAVVVGVAAYCAVKSRAVRRRSFDVVDAADARRAGIKESADEESAELERLVKGLEKRIAECDAEGERHIKVIDPATFGTQALMPPQEKKKQE